MPARGGFKLPTVSDSDPTDFSFGSRPGHVSGTSGPSTHRTPVMGCPARVGSGLWLGVQCPEKPWELLRLGVRELGLLPAVRPAFFPCLFCRITRSTLAFQPAVFCFSLWVCFVCFFFSHVTFFLFHVLDFKVFLISSFFLLFFVLFFVFMCCIFSVLSKQLWLLMVRNDR